MTAPELPAWSVNVALVNGHQVIHLALGGVTRPLSAAEALKLGSVLLRAANSAAQAGARGSDEFEARERRYQRGEQNDRDRRSGD